MKTKKELPYLPTDTLSEKIRKTNLKNIYEINKIDNLSHAHTEKETVAFVLSILAVIAATKVEIFAAANFVFAFEVFRQLALWRLCRLRIKERSVVLDSFLNLTP